MHNLSCEFLNLQQEVGPSENEKKNLELIAELRRSLEDVTALIRFRSRSDFNCFYRSLY